MVLKNSRIASCVRWSREALAHHMGIEEFEEYREECIPLTERDRDGLAKLLEDPEAGEFRGVISFMLDNGYKLEQESLLLN